MNDFPEGFSSDEIIKWAAKLDEMLPAMLKTHESLEKEIERLTNELDKERRMADLGRMAAHVAHEVRNHLVPVTLYLSLLERRLTEDTTGTDLLRKTNRVFDDLRAAVTDLMYFTADQPPVPEPFDVADLLDEIVATQAEQLGTNEITAKVSVATSLQYRGDRTMLGRAVLHLMRNAIDTMGDGGTLQISSAIKEDVLEITISDSGGGDSPRSTEDAFEPFHESTRGGTGLELAIVARIAEAHDGTTQAVHNEQGGVAYSLLLPIALPEEST